MNQLQKTASNDVAYQQLRDTNARVPEQWLLLVRIGIIIVASLAFLIFLVSLLLDYAQFRTICTITACADGQLTLESARTLEMLHVSLDAYAVINIVLLVIQALVYYGVAALIFWHKSNEWLAVCFIVGFLAGPTNFLSEDIADSRLYRRSCCAHDCAIPRCCTFILICYLFPNGRFVPRWTILVAALALVIAGFQTFLPDIVCRQSWLPLTG
jgi:hypothetical protein